MSLVIAPARTNVGFTVDVFGVSFLLQSSSDMTGNVWIGIGCALNISVYIKH